MARLTTAECQKLVQSDALRKVPDGGGLYLFIKGKGRAYWTAQFRNGTSWSSKGFGSFPDVTPKMARDAFDTWKVVERRAGVMALAESPALTQAAGAGKSFADAVQGWLGWKSADWRAGSRTSCAGFGGARSVAFQDAWPKSTRDAVLKALLGGAFRPTAHDGTTCAST